MLWVDEPDWSDETPKILVDALANSFSSPGAITDLVTAVGIEPADIPIGGTPRVIWAQLVRRAHEMAVLRPLVEEAALRIPASKELRHVLAATVAGAVPSRVFISYRREGTSGMAGRLYDRLADRFGDDQILMDVDIIPPGVDFTEVITQAVSTCVVLLALIGPTWLIATDEGGRRRLDDPDDIVRLEIAAALERPIRVIPILVEGAAMPRRQELPEALTGLARRNALILRHESFRSDADRLLAAIEPLVETGTPGSVAAGRSTPEAPEQRQYAKQETRTTPEAAEQIKREADAAAARVAEAQARQEAKEQTSQPRRPRIFLCYRREDTQWAARSIYESLADKYGHEHVFRDIDSTPAGIKFSTWIELRVGQCDVMIVLIGDAWSSAKDHTGQRRLDLPKDWVRQEIETALRRDIPIIPVRVQGARMPSEDELPPSIADFIGFQSAEVTDSRWTYDVGLLTQAIDDLIKPSENQNK
jgi:hypothetical protein